jgi:O-antigen/teichoic acid export membrane protein
VFTARCFLCVPAVVLSVVAVQVAGQGSAHPWADSLSIAALACVLGWPANWYLQATQQLDRWARVELVVHAVMLVGCWLFAHSVLAYLLMQGAASSVLASLGWRWLRRDFARSGTPSLWARPELGPGLRLGWTMLPVSIAGAAYSFALPAAASLQMAKTELGIYFLADRFVRAVLNAADPVISVVYPRMVMIFATSARAALRYAMAWAAGGAALGALLLGLGHLLWPALEPMLTARAGAIDVPGVRATLLVLGWLLPLLLGWKFIGYWMLGSGRYDTAYRACVIVGGIVGVIGAATWGAAAGATGLAWTAVGVELVVIAVAVGGVALTRRERTGA